MHPCFAPLPVLATLFVALPLLMPPTLQAQGSEVTLRNAPLLELGVRSVTVQTITVTLPGVGTQTTRFQATTRTTQGGSAGPILRLEHRVESLQWSQNDRFATLSWDSDAPGAMDDPIAGPMVALVGGRFFSDHSEDGTRLPSGPRIGPDLDAALALYPEEARNVARSMLLEFLSEDMLRALAPELFLPALPEGSVAPGATWRWSGDGGEGWLRLAGVEGEGLTQVAVLVGEERPRSEMGSAAVERFPVRLEIRFSLAEGWVESATSRVPVVSGGEDPVVLGERTVEFRRVG